MRTLRCCGCMCTPIQLANHEHGMSRGHHTWQRPAASYWSGAVSRSIRRTDGSHKRQSGAGFDGATDGAARPLPAVAHRIPVRGPTVDNALVQALSACCQQLRLDIRNAKRHLPLCRLGAFSRASERNRALPRTDASLPLQGLLAYCKELAVSYTGLLLTMDMFPQVGILMHHQQQGNV